MARALHRVMPPIEVVKGSPYNIAPDASDSQIDEFLNKRLVAEGNKDYVQSDVSNCNFTSKIIARTCNCELCVVRYYVYDMGNYFLAK